MFNTNNKRHFLMYMLTRVSNITSHICLIKTENNFFNPNLGGGVKIIPPLISFPLITQKR